MMVLWDGPEFKAKAQKPATEVLPPMLRRAWHDVRGAARVARKDSSAANLHKLRIRMKNLRYGCETVALVEGSPGRLACRAAPGQTRRSPRRLLLHHLARVTGRAAARSLRAHRRPGRRPTRGRTGHPPGLEEGVEGARAPLEEVDGLTVGPGVAGPGSVAGPVPVGAGGHPK